MNLLSRNSRPTYVRNNNQNHPNDSAIQSADIRWDENQQPLSTQFDDIYFSRSAGLDESRYVFIQQNHLEQRWAKLADNEHFTIAETGFGTGLNFLATWQLWDKHKPKSNSNRLHFFSTEKFPLTKPALVRALSLWPELKKYAEQLEAYYPPQFIAGPHKIYFGDVTLTLFIGDVIEGVSELIPALHTGPQTASKTTSLGLKSTQVDAWYLDGFAPSKNPDMWQPKLFELMARASHKQTSFATFTSAGDVRRGLTHNGFTCKKTRGFGRKREMLFGCFDSVNLTHLPSDNYSSWYLCETKGETKVKTATVIGGGLAGCHIAHALAKRGLDVRILEKSATLASGASGNRRGLLYTRLSPHNDPLSDFNLHALLYACRFYEQHNLFSTAGEQCGILHLAQTEKEYAYYRKLAERFTQHPDYLRWLDNTNSLTQTGISLKHDGLLLEKAGWLSPVDVCQQLCEHKNIQVLHNASVERIAFNEEKWSAFDSKSSLAQSDILVVANAQAALHFSECAHLDLKSIRGQITHLENLPTAIRTPQTAICGDGYLSPLDDMGLCIGASFNLNDEVLELSIADHVKNLERLNAMSDEYTALTAQLDPAKLTGRVGFRCTTPDYFPIAGPLPKISTLREQFAFLSKKANANIDSCGAHYPGLFCLLGLGSRGLAYAPLVADAIASTVVGEALPVSMQTWLHLHPARFIIRNLIRNKPPPRLNS